MTNNSIPTRREEDLRAQTLWTVVGRELGELATSAAPRVIEADMSNSFLSVITLVIAAALCAASNHTESLQSKSATSALITWRQGPYGRESAELLALTLGALEVVDGHTALLLNL